MKFIEEQGLVEAFWKKYGYRSNILRHQFECPCRKGNIDLVTIEEYQGRIMIVGFEFKLDDIKKALAQAEEDLEYCTKVFVVVPKEKVKTVLDKYSDYLSSKKFIGVIGVEYGSGRWEINYKAQMQNDVLLSYNQEIMKLMLLNVSEKRRS